MVEEIKESVKEPIKEQVKEETKSSSPTPSPTTPPQVFDMFSDDLNINVAENTTIKLDDDNSEMFDNEEGYYITRVGEIFYDRYRVLGEFGKGVFSTVLHCEDIKNGNSKVAIKVTRSNDIMTKDGIKIIIL